MVVLAVVVWSWVVSCVHCVKVTVGLFNSNLHTVHTAYDPAQSNSNLHTVHTAYDPAQSNSNLHTVHTAYDPAPHNHSQHNQCRTPYVVIHGLVLLMMGIMMPETC